MQGWPSGYGARLQTVFSRVRVPAPALKMKIAMLILGFALIMIGLTIMLLAVKEKQETKQKVQIGIGGFIGPIPFGFFNSKQALLLWITTLVLMIILFAILSIMFRLIG